MNAKSKPKYNGPKDGQTRFHPEYTQLMGTVQNARSVADWTQAVLDVLHVPMYQHYDLSMSDSITSEDESAWLDNLASAMVAINLVTDHGKKLLRDPAPHMPAHTLLEPDIMQRDLSRQLYEYAYASSQNVGRMIDTLLPSKQPTQFLVLHPTMIYHPLTQERQTYVTVRRGVSVLY